MKNITEKVFLVTGGTSGVGKATAISLAQKGAKIVIVSRDEISSQKALEDIARRTGNDKGDYLIADLSLQSSVKRVTEEFKQKYDNLHVLANCAGALFPEMQLTAEGFERNFAVNYLSHFWLTTNLLDILKESGPSRIITVTGNPLFLKNANINFDDLQYTNKFNGFMATGHAMFARLFFTFELASRLKGTNVTANTFNPGVMKSNLAANSAWYFKMLAFLFKLTEKDTCDVSAYLSMSEEVEKISGKFFNKDRRIVPFDEKFDPTIGERLWVMTEQLTETSK